MTGAQVGWNGTSLSVRGVTVVRRRVVLSDLGSRNLNGRICCDQACDVFVCLALRSEFLDLIADHSYERLDGKHLRAEACGISESLLGADGLLNKVGFHASSPLL